MTNKSKITVRANGLQGQEAHNRMIELMGFAPIKENVGRSTVELTKKGPDGKVYGIIRENHSWYIKIANGEGLTKDSFDYIGGIQNKSSNAYPSYSKAIKQLNFKFQSLNEAMGVKGNINVFRNDNLLTEDTVNTQKFVTDKKGDKLEMDASDTAEDGITGDNLVGKNGKKKADKDWEKVNMSEDEKRIDSMISGEAYVEEIVEESMLGAASFFQGDDIVLNMNNTLSIGRGVDIVDTDEDRREVSISEATNILSKLSKAEIIAILENVTGKKKI